MERLMELYEEVYRDLYRTAYCMMGNPADAEDAVRTFIQEENDSGISFGNARGVRNTFEKVLVHQANRLAAMQELKKEDLMQLTEQDILELLPKAPQMNGDAPAADVL